MRKKRVEDRLNQADTVPIQGKTLSGGSNQKNNQLETYLGLLKWIESL
jgi:hypothetical protein